MTRPHAEGFFYTILSRDPVEQSEIYDRWKKQGIWDPRITAWEVGALESEERIAARMTYATFIESPYGSWDHCPICNLTATPHCDGCVACPGMPHEWWCHGDTCICGCPKSRHYHKTIRGATTAFGRPYTIARRCRGRKCGCPGYEDVEYQGSCLAWADCTDEERAERRALARVILQEWALGLGPFEGERDGRG